MGLLRLFLAFIVASGHVYETAFASRFAIEGPARLLAFGTYAVIFFYVISGFLISLVLSRRYQFQVGPFYRARFSRIFGLYWPIAAFILVLSPTALTRFLHASPLDKFTSITLIGIDWNLSISKAFGVKGEAMLQYLPQSWTLGTELAFYIAAPFLLRSMAATVLAALLSLAFRAWLYATHGASPVLGYLFPPSTFIFFLLGHIAQRASARWAILMSPRVWPPCLAICAALLLVPPVARWIDTLPFVAAITFFALSVPGLFHATKDIRWMNLIGELSYPFYLLHVVVMALLRQWPEFYGEAFMSSLAAVLGGTTLLAALAHFVVERPFARFLRWCWPAASQGDSRDWAGRADREVTPPPPRAA
jgi:peptidoglycan/LPS O-acetylase OafA/YrhL